MKKIGSSMKVPGKPHSADFKRGTWEAEQVCKVGKDLSFSAYARIDIGTRKLSQNLDQSSSFGKYLKNLSFEKESTDTASSSKGPFKATKNILEGIRI